VGWVALNVFNTPQNLQQHTKPVGASLLAILNINTATKPGTNLW
jgi:hypothetical protein